MILQFIMKMTLIQHYEYSYQATTMDRPYGQNTPTMDFPKNYALRIDPDTHVRASLLREDRFTRCVDFPK